MRRRRRRLLRVGDQAQEPCSGRSRPSEAVFRSLWLTVTESQLHSGLVSVSSVTSTPRTVFERESFLSLFACVCVDPRSQSGSGHVLRSVRSSTPSTVWFFCCAALRASLPPSCSAHENAKRQARFVLRFVVGLGCTQRDYFTSFLPIQYNTIQYNTSGLPRDTKPHPTHTAAKTGPARDLWTKKPSFSFLSTMRHTLLLSAIDRSNGCLRLIILGGRSTRTDRPFWLTSSCAAVCISV